MIENSFWKTIKRITSRSGDRAKAPVDDREPRIFVEKIEFSNGQILNLQKNSIVVVTGPNNSGKSSVLQFVEQGMRGYASSPVVKLQTVSAHGSAESFRQYIERRCVKNADGTMSLGYSNYNLKGIENDIKRSFVGSEVGTLFVSRLGAAERLQSVGYTRRGDWLNKSPTEPLQWLDIEVDAEDEISEIFRKSFGLSLVVNRLAGEHIILHTNKGDVPDFDDFRSYAEWLKSLPQLSRQGDGMKSFASVLMSVKVHPRSMILLDEPEAFLHYPQARKLAEVITSDTSPDTQIWIATHSDEVVKGLLDSTNDRVIVVRLDRNEDKSVARVLKSEEVKALWSDPLLRTSDILSALFHEVAIICEGVSDARFFRAMVDATKNGVRRPDIKFYSVGGKDKILSIVTALRPLGLPVCAICDLDVLAEPSKFYALFEALGGSKADVEHDIRLIVAQVAQRQHSLSGSEAAKKLFELAEQIGSEPTMTPALRNELSKLSKEGSGWSRLKADGYVAFDNSTVIQAFERVYERSRAVGLLINREGELEGLCRDANKSPKSAWIEEVLERNLKSDRSLEDARRMLAELWLAVDAVRQSFV